MEEKDIPPPPTPIIIQLYEDLGEQLLDIVEEKCGDSRVVSSVCPTLTDAQQTINGKSAGKSLRKTEKRVSTKSTECKLASKESESKSQKVRLKSSIGVENETVAASYIKYAREIPSESCKVKLKPPTEGNFSHGKGSKNKMNASKPKTAAQETTRVQKGERHTGEPLPKITVTAGAGNKKSKAGVNLQTKQIGNNASKKCKGTHLSVSDSDVRQQDKDDNIMTETFDNKSQSKGDVSQRDGKKTVKVKTIPRKKTDKSNDLKSEVNIVQNTAESSKDNGKFVTQCTNNKALTGKNEEKIRTTEDVSANKNSQESAQENATKTAEHSKDSSESKGTKPSSGNSVGCKESTSPLKKEKEKPKTNNGVLQPKDDVKKKSSDAPVAKKWTLELDTSQFHEQNSKAFASSRKTVEKKDGRCASKPAIPKEDVSRIRLTDENTSGDDVSKKNKGESTKTSNNTKVPATKDWKSKKPTKGTEKRNLRLCEVVQKGDRSVPKYKDMHLNVKEKKGDRRTALEVTSMECEELKEANMYLTKILGVEKNARTIQLIDQMQRHQRTLETELQEARKKETLAHARAEKAERQADDICQQVEEVCRSRDKVINEKEKLLQDFEQEKKAYEKVRQHVDSVGKMRQRAHQLKENALREKNKLAKEIEAERAKMSAMLSAMKDVNKQKFSAERRRLNMVRMKNRLAKERDEERSRLRELQETMEEMKKEKDEAVKQKYNALKQRDQARTNCRKLTGELKELRESVESLSESGCYVLETTERLTVVENTRPSAMTNSKDRIPRSRFPSIDNKRPNGTQRVLRSKVLNPGIPKLKNPTKLPPLNQRQGAKSSETVDSSHTRNRLANVHPSRPIQYNLQNAADQWSSAYSHDVTESDRSGAEFYDWGFYDDDHLPPVDHARNYVAYPNLQATGHQRTLVNRHAHGGEWKKYPTGETIAPHLCQSTLSDTGFHSNADVNFEESDVTTTESSSHGNTVDRQVSAHLEGLANDPRAQVGRPQVAECYHGDELTGYHRNMVDRQVSAHLGQWGCRNNCGCAKNGVDQSESVTLPLITSDDMYRQAALNSSIIKTPPRIKFPKL